VLKRRYSGYVVAAFCLLRLVPSDLRAAEVQYSIEPAVHVSSWVMDPASRTVYAALQANSELAAFDPASGAESRRVTLGTKPKQLVMTSAGLAVITDSRVLVYDPQKLEQLMSFQDVGAPRLAAVPSTGNADLYLFTWKANSFTSASLLELDFHAAKVRSLADWRAIRTSSPTQVVVDPPGEHILLREGQPGSASVRLYSVDLRKPEVEEEARQTTSANVIQPGLAGKEWWVGATLFADDLKTVVYRAAGDAAIQHPRYDLVASRASEDDPQSEHRGTLWLRRFSDRKTLAEISLDRPIDVAIPDHVRYYHRKLSPQLQWDAAGRHLLCVAGGAAFVVDLEPATLAGLRPLLQLDLPGRFVALTGQPLRLPLKIVNGSAGDDVKFRLRGAPAGVEIEDQTLMWTPSASDLGVHTWQVAASNGQQTSKSVLVVQVEVPHVATGVNARQIVAGDPSDYVCVVGPAVPPEGLDPRRSQAGYGPATKLTVVDMRDLSIVLHHSMQSEAREVFIDEDYVYWLPRTVNVLHRLKIEPGGKQDELPLQDAVLDFFPLGKSQLVLILGDAQHCRPLVLDRQTLQPIENAPISQYALPSGRELNNELTFSIGDDTLYYCGRLLNAADGTFRCYPAPIYRAMQLVQLQRQSPWIQTSATWRQRWRRIFSDQGVSKGRGGSLFGWPSRYWDVSEVYPVAVTVRSEKQSNLMIHFILELRDLVYGQVVYTEKLPITFDGGRPELPYPTLVKFAGDRVVVAAGDELVVHRIPERVLKDVLAPIRLLYPRVATTSVSQPVTIDLEVRGGKAPYHFRLDEDVTGVTVDEATGRLQIDMPRVWTAFLADVAAGQRYDVLAAARSPERMDMRPSLVRTEPGESPFDMPLEVTVADESGQSDTIVFRYVAIGTTAGLNAAVDRGQSVQEQRQQQMMGARPAIMPQPKSQAGVDQRLDDLDRRLQRVERLLEDISKKLDADQPGPGRTGSPPPKLGDSRSDQHH
jgi:hypothetical protein